MSKKRNSKKFKKKLRNRANSTKNSFRKKVEYMPITINGKSYDIRKKGYTKEKFPSSELSSWNLLTKGISKGYGDLELYHITTPENFEKIQNSEGLKGNRKPNPNHGLSQKGYIYGTISSDKKIWDKIKETQLFDFNKIGGDLDKNKCSKPYVVIKIKGLSLKKRGIKIREDFNEGLSNSAKGYKFYIGDKFIPNEELEVVGNYKTDEKLAITYTEETKRIYSSLLGMAA